MNIISIEKSVYYLNWKERNLEVAVYHEEQEVCVIFKIDDLVVVERTLPVKDVEGMTDIDVIHFVEDTYIEERNTVDKYADIILHHSHEMQIVKRSILCSTEYCGAKINVNIEIENDTYYFLMNNNKTSDTVACTFSVNSISELLEKLRILLNGGMEINHAVAKHIDVLVKQHPLIRENR